MINTMSRPNAIIFTVLMMMTVPATGCYIETLNGVPSAFELIRNKARIKAAPYTLLETGDLLRVSGNNKKNHITLIVNKAAPVKLSYDKAGINRPYSIECSGNILPLEVMRIIRAVTPWFDRLYTYELTKSAYSGPRRGGRHNKRRLSMPKLLRDGKAKLSAGKRDLHLTWYGGKPPYSVRVCWKNRQSARKRCWQEKPNIHDEITVFKDREIMAGDYLVTIKDSQRTKGVRGKFSAIAESSPVLSSSETMKAIAQSLISEPAKQTLLAILLAGRENGKWGFEAYQQVAALDYHPALLARYGFEKKFQPNIKMNRRQPASPVPSP
ncbi:MAG: hypothetical protein GY862_11255 [Gammaproteobacteria bacterium]|nr:hypothetical protein [Gammaproteobacteria bacterium]